MAIKQKPKEFIEEEKEAAKSFISPLFLSKTTLEKIRKNIIKNSESDFEFVLQTLVAVFVIALGMIIDSTAVVIGGMLIAPLFWPILGFSLGLIEGRPSMITKSIATLIKSFITILAVSVVIGFFAPEQILQSQEFLSRTSPTIYDLLIGLIAGFLGAYIISHPRIASGFAGVVIAAAIVPPSVVVGVSLAKGDFASLGNSLLLTISSLIAIAFSAAALFFVSKFNHTNSRLFFQKQKENFFWFLVTLLIVIVPLIFLTNEIVVQVSQKQIISEIVENKFPGSSTTEISVNENNNIQNIKIVLQKNNELTNDEIRDLAEGISKELEKSVVLNVRVVPVNEKTEIVNF